MLGLRTASLISAHPRRLFKPDQISSCKFWLNVDDIAKANGAVVAGSDWSDRKGNVTPSGGDALNPTMVVNAINGRRSLAWSGSGNSTQRFGIGTTILGSVTSAAMFMVWKVNNDPPSSGRGGGAVTGFSSDTQSSHHPYQDGSIYDGFCSSARKTPGNPTPALTSFRIYSAHSASADWRDYIDGTQFFSTGTNTVNSGANTRYIGGSAGAVTDAFNGQIQCALGFDSSLTTSERQKTEGFLAWECAIASQLPGAQPYLNRRPLAYD